VFTRRSRRRGKIGGEAEHPSGHVRK
jgi:hypothetical protein